jgi:archaellum component FlaC
MFDADLLFAFFLMALLFLRQISILKKQHKINYAPLVIGIGLISSIIHFILHPETTNILLLLRESLFPLLVSLLLYFIMNIMDQTQKSQSKLLQTEFTQTLIGEVSELKGMMEEIESKMIRNQQDDRAYQEDMREKFKHDIKALDAINENGIKFLEKFNQVQEWHQDINHAFDDFINKQLPELDTIVHKHIDILRVSEQEHYVKLSGSLSRALDNRVDMSGEFAQLQEKLDSMKGISHSIADTITSRTLEQIAGVTQAFANQIAKLKSHAEAINTSLFESENKLTSIKSQSEMIMKQMSLSSKKMEDIEEQHSVLLDVYKQIQTLIEDIDAIKADYVKSQAQLSHLTKEMNFSQEEHKEALQAQLDELSSILLKKVDDSLEKLHEHYHIASEDITQSVKILARKAQVHKGYTQD